MSRPKGFKHTEETKARMRESHPHLHCPHTEETKRKISEASKEWYKTHHNPMKGRRLSEETRRRISLASNGNKYSLGKKHSSETKRKISLATQGENNPSWKGGLTELVKGIRGSPEFYQWRKAVLERDNHTCRDCETTEKLNAHHIQSILDYPEGVFEIANGLTSCDDCHKIHTSWQRLKRRKKVKH